MKLPKRSDTHIKESDSWRILQSRCPAEWIIREVSERDYGIDCYIELVNDNNEVTGDLLSVQLKATDKIEWRLLSEELKESTFSGISTQTIHYWMNFPVPVFLFVAGLEDRNVYFVPIKQEIRSQYSKYLKQESVSFTLTNIFQLGTTLGNNVFLALYYKEKSHNQFASLIRMLLIHWRRYLEFIQNYQGLDSFRGAEPDEELLFFHIYETLFTISKFLFLDWDIQNLGDILKKDREVWKDPYYLLHYNTFADVLPAIETKFFQIVNKTRSLLIKHEKEYWERTDMVLFTVAEKLDYLKPGFVAY